MLQNSVFFQKEACKFGRRDQKRVLGFLAIMGTLLLAVLAVLAQPISDPDDPISKQIAVYRNVLLLRFWSYAIFSYCILAGNWLGERVFKLEEEQGTLEGLLLCSLSRWRLISQKLLFPLAGWLTAWLFLLPFYAALALVGTALLSDVLRGWGIAGGVILAMLSLGAPLSPQPQRKRAPRSTSQTAQRRGDFGELFLIPPGLSICLLTIILNADWAMVVGGMGQTAKSSLPFFNNNLRLETYFWSLIGIVEVSTALMLLARTAPTSPNTPRLRLSGQWLPILTCYAVGVAVAWGLLPAWGKWLTVVGAPLIAAVGIILFRQRLPAASSSRSTTVERELQQLSTRWPNPILLRDLRAATRKVPLTLFWQHGIALGMVWAGILLAAAFTLPAQIERIFPALFGSSAPLWLRLAWQSGVVCIYLAPWLCLWGIAVLAASSGQFWRREFRAGTLSQLLATPVTTSALLRGRLAASVLMVLPVSLALFTPAPIALLGLILLGSDLFPLYLAFFALLSGWGFHITALVGLVNRQGKAAATYLDYVLVVISFGLVGAFIIVMDTFDTDRKPALLTISAGIAMALLHLGSAFLVFRRSAAEVESLRLSDMPSG